MCFLTHPDWETEVTAATYIFGAKSCYDIIEWLQAPYVFIVELFKENIIDKSDSLNVDRSFYLSTEIAKVLKGIADNRISRNRLTLLIPPHISKSDEFEIERISKIFLIPNDDGEKTFIIICRNGEKFSTDQNAEMTYNRQLIYDASL